MNDYLCYGLRIQSELSIPELLTHDREQNADVVVRYGDVTPLETEDKETGSFAIQRDPGRIRLWMNGVGGIDVCKGRTIIIDPAEGAEERGFRFLVSGIGLGFVLHQRDIPSLHASAVAIEGGVVAFIGWKGMGKSTTAAAFHRQGYPVVTDDVLPLHVKAKTVEVTPAFPHLKLFSNTVEAVFGEDPDLHPRLDPEGDKRACSVEQGFVNRTLPLQCVYVLDWGAQDSRPSTEELTEREACIELLRHSFALRMFKDEGATPRLLQRMSKLATRVPVRRLVRPRDLERVGELPLFVKQDLDALKSRTATGVAI